MALHCIASVCVLCVDDGGDDDWYQLNAHCSPIPLHATLQLKNKKHIRLLLRLFCSQQSKCETNNVNSEQ